MDQALIPISTIQKFPALVMLRDHQVVAVMSHEFDFLLLFSSLSSFKRYYWDIFKLKNHFKISLKSSPQNMEDIFAFNPFIFSFSFIPSLSSKLILPYTEGESMIYATLQLWLCDLLGPLVLIFWMRKEKLILKIKTFWFFSINLNDKKHIRI